MTDQIDTSTEAVKRLSDALLTQEQADMDGTMVKVSRQACDEAAATLRSLVSERNAMRKHGCLLGKDCDLSVAYMSGSSTAIDRLLSVATDDEAEAIRAALKRVS